MSPIAAGAGLLQWLPLIVGGLSAITAILAALISARSASRARTSQTELERIRRLEERVAEKKYVVYQPMIELLRDALSPSGARQFDSEAFQATFANFATWVGIFGSDEAVTAFRNLMQCTYHDAPTLVTLRLYGDFVVAARRDMGDPDTTTTVDEVLGIRLKDLYSDTKLRYVLSGPLEEVCESLEWEPPWTRET